MAFAPRLSNLVTMSVDPTPAELPPGLLAEYLESAGTQLRVLAELADRLAKVGNDAEALDRLRRETHKIRGSAGSYGFWEASRLAAGMEETAKDWVARPDDLDLDVAGSQPLLLLDVDLPALDGYSILETLTRERPGQYRVVFTTVHGDESEQLRGLEAGALDYLVKPISLRVALEKIRRWVGR